MQEASLYPSVRLSDKSPATVARQFRQQLAQGSELLPQGEARSDPETLLRRGYGPRFETALFGWRFYFAVPRQNSDIRFVVGYVQNARVPRRIYPRLFYKDVSLTWRSASHYIRSEGENWIGKGDVRVHSAGGVTQVESDEATTDLPHELQAALEAVNRSAAKVRHDETAVSQILRRGHDYRIEAYADFTRPRKMAAQNRANLVYGGRRVAHFARSTDPHSLKIVRGYEPDFAHGKASIELLSSSLYGGNVWRYRILASNRKIQYLFLHGPKHSWIASVQATSTQLSSYGVRVVDAVVDDLLLLPGFEFHYLDESLDPPEWYSQIPKGFAGRASHVDPSRADASAWLNKVTVIRQFKRWAANPDNQSSVAT